MTLHPASARWFAMFSLIATLTPNRTGAFETGRVGEFTTAVPVTTVSAQELDRSIPDVIEALQSLPRAPLSQGELTKLRGLTAFSGLTDQRINDYMSGLNTLTLDSIEAISRSDIQSVEVLLGAVRNERLNVGSSAVAGVVNFILRQDASTRIGDESVNIYSFPDPASASYDFKLFEPEGFKYLNVLADIGIGGRLGGYVGQPPNTVNLEAQWALANQHAAFAIASDRLDRLNDTVLVLDGIVDNLAVPSGIGGLSAHVGRQLLRADGWSDTQKRDAARELRGYIYGGMLPEAEQEVGYRALYRDSLQLHLNGTLPSNHSYNEYIKLAGNWNFDLSRTTGEFRWISVTGGGGSILNPTTQPQFTGRDRFWQISARLDGTKVEQEFTVPGADYLSSAWRWEDKLVVGAINVGSQMTTFYGYRDSDNDGRVEDNTRTTLFSTGMFTGGFDLGWNPALGEISLFDREMHGLHGLTGLDMEGFPTALTERGGFDDARMDLLTVGYSLDGKWATGYPDFSQLLVPHYRTSEALLNETSDEYEPLRVSFRYDEVELKAAAAEVPWAGSLSLRATYTPDAVLNAYKLDGGNWLQAGTGKADPYGRVMIGFNQPLEAGQQIRLGEDPEEASPAYVVPELRAGPEFYDLDVYRGDNAKVGLFGEPETQVELYYTADFDQWDFLAAGLTSMFGGYSTKADFDGPHGFVHAFAYPKQTLASIDYIVAEPGREVDIHPGWNDRFVVGMAFALAGTVPPEVIQFFAATGSVRLRAHTSGQGSIAYEILQNAVFIQASQMVVYPEYRKLFFPPVLLDDQLNPYVRIRCLVINGENYPMYQFNLARPDFCVDTHWHKPPPGRVYHLNGDATGTPDPNPPGCGFGGYLEVPQTEVILPLLVYRFFVGLHAPTIPLQ